MKILAIIGTGRKKGNTSKLVETFKEKVEHIAETQSLNLEFEKLFLVDYQIQHCIGCRICFNSGEEKCPFRNDDVKVIKQKIMEADAIIFASPVYVGDVSSLMKALIDRLAHVCHRPQFYEKVGLILATTGGSMTGHATRTIAGAFYSWGLTVAGIKGFSTSDYISKENLEIKYGQKIKKLAKKCVSSLKRKSYLNPSTFNLAMFLMRKKYWSEFDKESYDFKHYESQGWLEKDQIYYFQYEPSYVKKVAAKVLCKIMDAIIVN